MAHSPQTDETTSLQGDTKEGGAENAMQQPGGFSVIVPASASSTTTRVRGRKTREYVGNEIPEATGEQVPAVGDQHPDSILACNDPDVASSRRVKNWLSSPRGQQNSMKAPSESVLELVALGKICRVE